MSLYFVGPMGQATSYRIAALACGLIGLAIGLAWLALPRPTPESRPQFTPSQPVGEL